jgi:2-keto-4-pentenoate hydratase/2-oxohepta-3-ene-1,7-dioic acid hydratase in catechol pathway
MKIGRVGDESDPSIVLELDGHWFDIGRGLESLWGETEGLDVEHNLLEWIEHGMFAPEKIAKMIHQLNENNTLKNFKISEPHEFLMVYAPKQIICVGRNYAEHAKELGNEVPESPILFNKLPSTCVGDGTIVSFPKSLGQVDFEGEIAVVIGKNGSNIPRNEAIDHIAGYTLLNDITARGMQSELKAKGHPWMMAKNYPGFCPFGPVIRLVDEISHPLNLNLRVSINGEEKQNGTTTDFIFPLPVLISAISAHIPLYPGDLIATGTPEGVGPLKDGDDVVLFCPEIGTLNHSVEVNSK